MNRADTAAKLKAMIEEQAEIKIASLDQRIDLDSYNMMMVITFVREELGVELDLDQFDFDVFQSVDSFVDLVMKQAQPA
jgi:acyl carrier protein